MRLTKQIFFWTMVSSVIADAAGTMNGGEFVDKLVGVGGACLLVVMWILMWDTIVRRVFGRDTKDKAAVAHGRQIFEIVKKDRRFELRDLQEFGTVDGLVYARARDNYYFGTFAEGRLSRRSQDLPEAIANSWISADSILNPIYNISVR